MYYLDLLGTMAFAVGGAYKAKSMRLNIFGAIFMGAITAVGGGTVRDLIIGRTPLFYLQDQNYLLLCLAFGMVTYFLPDFFKKTYSIFRFIDSIGLATFVIIGVSVCHRQLFNTQEVPAILSALACIFLGILTGSGGGILRDAILGDTPYSLKKGSGYITCAFLGSAFYYLLMFYHNKIAIAVSIAVTMVMREIVSPFGIYKRLFRKVKIDSA